MATLAVGVMLSSTSQFQSLEPGGGAPLVCRIRAANRDDEHEVAYLRNSFGESFKQSSVRLDRMPWPTYKHEVVPELHAVLDAPETRVLVADCDGLVAGWMALAAGRRVDTVHWIYTRWKIGAGEKLRRRGVMRSLVEVAQLKSKLVYTLRGVKRSHEWIVPWLAGRGVTAAYVPLKEWIR